MPAKRCVGGEFLAAQRRYGLGFVKAWHKRHPGEPLTASDDRLAEAFSVCVADVGPTIFKGYIREAAADLGLTRRRVTYQGGQRLEYIDLTATS